MKVFVKRMLACGLTGAMILSMAACGSSTKGDSGKEEKKAATDSTGVPTITFYPRDANLTSGLVEGFKGDYFASRGFNLDVWAYSDEKTNAILSSGDLPDVMFIPEESLDTMIKNDMLLNLDEYLDDMPHVSSYEPLDAALKYVKKYKSADTGSVYGIPIEVGDNCAKYAYVNATERNAVRLNWDIYEEIGAPEINNFDDLLDVMEQMQEAHPTDEEGNAFYGTVLNNGSDTDFWASMVMWYRFQGYQEEQLPYLLEADMINGTFSSILSKDSMYYKGLKWYNEAYKRGLMDPDSINNDRPTQKAKVDGGYTQIPSGYLPGWASTYLEYYIPDTNIYYNATNTYGDVRYMIGINANTENLDACLAFVDMLADPDAYLTINNGPDGEFWYSDDSGNAYFTEEGMDYLEKNGGDMTGYTLSNGETLEYWNSPFIAWNGAATSFSDGEGGIRTASVSGWTELNELNIDNESFHAWQETTGYETWKDWLEAEGAYYSESELANLNSFTSLPDDTMKLTVDAIKDKVVNASWQMVYAEDDTTFDALWNQMIVDCEGLGAQEVIDWRLADLENAMEVRDSLENE